MLSAAEKQTILARLKRIEGQVSGIHRMVEKDAYCVDILHQISAVQAAEAQVAKIVLGQHVRTCVKDTFSGGSEAERNQKIEELMEVITRMGRIGKR